MTYEILLVENLKWREFSGALYFSRYEDNNPGLLLKTNDGKIVVECTVNIPDFFGEHPFGDNKIVIINEDIFTEGILHTLIENAIIEEPLFSIDDVEGHHYPVCELTEPVVDLLKAYGEYYV